jgi:hypothetical protein
MDYVQSKCPDNESTPLSPNILPVSAYISLPLQSMLFFGPESKVTDYGLGDLFYSPIRNKKFSHIDE